MLNRHYMLLKKLIAPVVMTMAVTAPGAYARQSALPVDTVTVGEAVVAEECWEDNDSTCVEPVETASISSARLGINGRGVWTPMQVTASVVFSGGNKFYVRYTLLHANGRPVANTKVARNEWVSSRGVITHTSRIDVNALTQPVTRTLEVDIKRYLLQGVDLMSAVKVRIDILGSDRALLARMETNTVRP